MCVCVYIYIYTYACIYLATNIYGGFQKSEPWLAEVTACFEDGRVILSSCGGLWALVDAELGI